MKNLALITVFVFLVSTNAQLFDVDLTAAPIPFSTRALKPQPGWPCLNASGWSCKDCKTLQYCEDNSFQYQITCGVQFPGRDYCNPDTSLCSHNRDDCQEIITGMNCPAPGLYPDIEDCRKYISCPSKGSNGISYNCLHKSNYGHASKRCLTNNECYTVTEDCQGQYKAIQYKPVSNLYVICRGANRPFLKDCGYSLVFNVTTMACEFQCTTEGYFANPNNESRYYICVHNGYEIQKYEANCVDGTAFNEKTGNCIQKKLQ